MNENRTTIKFIAALSVAALLISGCENETPPESTSGFSGSVITDPFGNPLPVTEICGKEYDIEDTTELYLYGEQLSATDLENIAKLVG